METLNSQTDDVDNEVSKDVKDCKPYHMMTSTIEAPEIVQITPPAESLLITHTQNHEAYKCPEKSCSFTTSSPSLLGLHKAQTHKIKTGGNRKGVITQYFCPAPGCYFNPTSGRFFKVLDRLKTHYMKIHVEKKFKCCKCQRAFGLERDCLRHEKDCGETFTCNECGKEYSNKPSLINHCLSKGHKQPPCLQKAPKVVKSNLKVSKNSTLTTQNHQPSEKSIIPILPRLTLPNNVSILIPTTKSDLTQSLCHSFAALGKSSPSISEEANVITVSDKPLNQVEVCSEALTNNFSNSVKSTSSVLGNVEVYNSIGQIQIRPSPQPTVATNFVESLQNKSTVHKFSSGKIRKANSKRRQIPKHLPTSSRSSQNSAHRSDMNVISLCYINESLNLATEAQLNENGLNLVRKEVQEGKQSEPISKKFKRLSLSQEGVTQTSLPPHVQPMNQTHVAHAPLNHNKRKTSIVHSGENHSNTIKLIEQYTPTQFSAQGIIIDPETQGNLTTQLNESSIGFNADPQVSYNSGSTMPQISLVSVAQTQTFLPHSTVYPVNDSQTQTLQSFMLDSLNSLLTDCETQTFESSAPFSSIVNDSETQTTMESDELLYQLLDDCEKQAPSPFSNFLNESSTQTFLRSTSDSITQTLDAITLDSMSQTSTGVIGLETDKDTYKKSLPLQSDDISCQVDPEDLFMGESLSTYDMMTQTLNDFSADLSTADALNIATLQSPSGGSNLNTTTTRLELPPSSQSSAMQAIGNSHASQHDVAVSPLTQDNTGMCDATSQCFETFDSTTQTLDEFGPLAHFADDPLDTCMAEQREVNLPSLTFDSVTQTIDSVNSGSFRDNMMQTVSIFDNVTQTANSSDTTTQTAADTFDMMIQTHNNFDRMTQTSCNFDTLSGTVNNLDIMTQTANSFDIMTQTLNKFDTTTQTSHNLNLFPKPVNNFDIMTQTADRLDTTTQTVDSFEMATQNVNLFDTEIQAAENFDILTQTSTGSDTTMAQALIGYDPIRQTANGLNIFTQTSNNFDTMTQTSNNYDTTTQTTNDFDTMTQTSNNFDIMTQTSNYFDTMTQTSNNFDIMTQTTNNFDTMTQTSNNFDIMTQTSNNFDIMTQTSNNFDTMMQTANFDTFTQTVNDFDIMTQTNDKFDTTTQTAAFDLLGEDFGCDMFTQTGDKFSWETTTQTDAVMTQDSEMMAQPSDDPQEMMSQQITHAQTKGCSTVTQTQAAENGQWDLTSQGTQVLESDMMVQPANDDKHFWDMMPDSCSYITSDTMTQTGNIGLWEMTTQTDQVQGSDRTTQTADVDLWEMVTQTEQDLASDMISQAGNNVFLAETQTSSFDLTCDIFTQTRKNASWEITTQTDQIPGSDVMTQTLNFDNETVYDMTTQTREVDFPETPDMGLDSFTQTDFSDLWEMSAQTIN